MATPRATREILDNLNRPADFQRASESAGSPGSDATRQRDRLLEIWADLADAYGSAFVNQFGTEPNDTWAAGLATYPVEKIRAAIGYLFDSSPHDFAPNLATIRNAIRGLDGSPQHQRTRMADHARANALPAPAPLPREEALAELAKIKAMIAEFDRVWQGRVPRTREITDVKQLL